MARVTPLAAQESRQATPNVILILTDEMGWADLGSYGAPEGKTPNIDAEAKGEGR